MKTLEDYATLPYQMGVAGDKDEGGFVVSFPDLPGCTTYGQTAETIVSNTRGAERAWVVITLEDGVEIPEPDSLEDYSGQFKLRIPRSLHRALAQHPRQKGTNMNQHCLYLLFRNDALQAP